MHKIAFFLLLFLSSNSYSQKSTKYLYAQLDTNSQFDYAIQYGEIELQKKKRFKKHMIEDGSNNDAFIKKVSDEFKSLPKERQNVLFFIHGMMGHHSFYLSTVANTLDHELYSKDDSRYGMVVYLIWRAGMNYGKNIKQTLKMGEEFALLIQNINENAVEINHDAEMSVICHSMGNRVFQGIYNKYADDGFSTPPFTDVVLAAADLESDIFGIGKPLNSIGDIANEIHVYFHEYDRTLMMSQLLNQNNRLGLQGISDLDSIPKNIMLIDASYLDDQDNLPGKNTNHRYFFTSPTVRDDLYNLLHNTSEDKLLNRKELDHPQKFALLENQ